MKNIEMKKICDDSQKNGQRFLKRTMEKELKRCGWANDELLINYHDNEYGKIKTDDQSLFEKLCLEGFQAGLSWRTVLIKRDSLRKAFFDFDIQKCASLSDEYLLSLMQDDEIIKNKRKIFSVRNNAQRVLEVILEYESFFRFIYSFKEPNKLLLAFKKYHFSFVGETICESFMQSIGIIEAHEPHCYLYHH